jgi:arylsulfatase A-like enzyme/Tfp pilus assembly protein PilF
VRPESGAFRRALRLLALIGAPLLTAGCGGDGSPAGAAAGAGPVHDVLLITVDTLRADSLGFARHPRAATPVLDRLAAAGVVFPDAHAHSVMTLPSHANILTGRYPFDHGVRDNGGFVLADDVPTAATLLREAGFRTAAFVGAFPLDARYGLGRGFEVYDDRYPEGGRAGTIPERRGDRVVALGRAWWQEHAGERRFLWLHLFDPHAPYEPPEPFASRFAAEPYLGEVAAVDSFLAPLLEPLLDEAGESAGEDRPTLVVFTSDHGEALGEHGELTHGLFAYEATLRVPLVLWGPALAPGRSELPARHVDLLPTILEAAGVAAPEGLPGRSLLAPEATAAEPVDSYFEALNANLTRGWAPLRGVLRSTGGGSRKLISLPLPELYDLAEDPDEERNLYAADERGARELARRIPPAAMRPPAPSAVGPVEARALRSLGYLAGAAAPREEYGPGDDPKNLVALDRKSHQLLDLFRRGRLEEATRLAREVVAERPGMAIAHYHLAQVLLERGLLPEAIAAMEAAVARGAASADLLEQLGLSLAQAGRPERAVELLAPLAVASRDPNLLATYALALSDAGRHEPARTTLLRIFELDPTNPRGRELLALVALRQERWQDAEAEARRTLEAADDRPDALNYLGVALYNQGRAREALDAWRRAAELDPTDLEVLFNLYRVAAEAGDRRLAADALRRFIAGAPPERFAADLERARALLAELEAEGAAG